MKVKQFSIIFDMILNVVVPIYNTEFFSERLAVVNRDLVKSFLIKFTK